MKINFAKKAQSITDYVLLVGIISAALFGLQTYMKRGIQATIKVAADEMGEQREGAVDYDYRYEWKWKGIAATTSVAAGATTATYNQGGAVSYGKDETTTQKGILSWGMWRKRE